jgi:DNA repair exonuclease SbcCD ATPase subunit
MEDQVGSYEDTTSDNLEPSLLIDHPVPPPVSNNETPISSAPPTPSSTTTGTPTPTTIEGLEDRYNKLKAITLKYKKKISEQTAEIDSLKERSIYQNASKIQLEYDKKLDEIEKLKKLESTLQKDLQKTVEENIQLKIKESESVSQIQSLSSSHKLLREKLDKLELDSVTVGPLKEKVESLEKELQEVKGNSVEAQHEKRQLQMLSLEVADYEKKLHDAHGILETKKVECEKLLVELASRDDKVKELEISISNYKESENKLILAKDSLQVQNHTMI